MAKAYFIHRDRYLRYDVEGDRVDAGYPKALTAGWAGLAGTGFESGFDTAIDLGNGKVYLFKGAEYLRIDQQQNQVDGPVRSIAEAWGGFAGAGFTEAIDAAINWGNGKAYFFRSGEYISYDIGSDSVDDGQPQPVAGNWPGFTEAGFADGVDAAINWGNGKAYFFRGDFYVRYSVGVGVDAGYPAPIVGNWPGFAEAGFDSVDAAWVKLAMSLGPGPAPTPTGVRLAPGDHVWYYDGQISTALDIPRGVWFPDSTGPTDYLGHGDEIFNFVIHAGGEIYRGRPHMRGREGTFAWLNNNPGNITGVPGGMDLGQYRDKFNWHHFLIFPSFQAGYDAIALFLRQGSYPAKSTGLRRWPAGRYRDLGITDAFHRYAPEEDGNDPESYGASVAAAAGVSTTTLIRDLDGAQMRHMQDKIVQIEGSVPGVILTRDSADLPEVIRAALA